MSILSAHVKYGLGASQVTVANFKNHPQRYARVKVECFGTKLTNYRICARIERDSFGTKATITLFCAGNQPLESGTKMIWLLWIH